MKRIIVNGANGYVASHFIRELLSQGYEVIALARENDKSSARERVVRALSSSGGNKVGNLDNLKVYGYSLLDVDFGMSRDDLKSIFGMEADYFHFAASLKYDFKSKSEILETNIDGVENSLNVYRKFAATNSRFFFIGTAYSCGNFNGRFEEKFYPDQDVSHFRNYYEYSKRLAENLVKKHMDNFELDAYIIRLSQVVGHSKTGVTTTDYGVFDFSKRLHGISRRNPDETVRIKVDPDSTQNLIPIDTVVNYLQQTVKVDDLPTIMNFVANHSIQNIQVIDTLNDLLDINIIPKVDLNTAELSRLEKLISIGMSFTGRYTTIDLKFDTSERDKVIRPETNEISAAAISRMLQYFITEVCERPPKKVAEPVEN